MIGTTVSGTFLYAIAILNIVILVSIVRIFLAMRRGAYDEQELEQQLNSRGLMNRLFGRRLNAITQPWQMYPVGVLFGLGFDPLAAPLHGGDPTGRVATSRAGDSSRRR